MLYFIERVIDDIPFDETFHTCVIKHKMYDIVESNRNTGLDSISEHIFDTGTCTFSKTNPRESNDIKTELKKLNYTIKELLLG